MGLPCGADRAYRTNTRIRGVMGPDGAKIRKKFRLGPCAPLRCRASGGSRCRWHPLACIAVPPRRPDLGKLLAALNEQRTALGEPPWSGLATERVLGAASPGSRDRRASAAVRSRCDPPCALPSATALACSRSGYRAARWRCGSRRSPRSSACRARATPAARPPNVVETDPLTWLDLADGRVGWAKCGRVRPSAGQRPARGSICLPSAHVQRRWQAGRSLDLTSD